MARRKSTSVTGGRPAWFTYVVLGIVILTALFPFYWTILIGSGDQYTLRAFEPFELSSWIPGGNLWTNIQSVIGDANVNFWRSLANSFIVAIAVSFTTVMLSTLAGFAFAKLRFKGSGPLLVAVIATMAVPVQLGAVPLYIVMNKLGLVGNLWGVIIPGLVSAFGVFWMTQYMQQSLPDELIEAARVDGCTMFGTFRNVALPSVRPAAAMLALFTFITSWTNFFWPYIVLGNSQAKTLPVALQVLQANYFVDYSVVLSGVLLSTIPLLILFIFAGRHLVSGIMQGAVKG